MSIDRPRPGIHPVLFLAAALVAMAGGDVHAETIEITLAKIGRLIKNLLNIASSSSSILGYVRFNWSLRGSVCGIDCHPWPSLL